MDGAAGWHLVVLVIRPGNDLRHFLFVSAQLSGDPREQAFKQRLFFLGAQTGKDDGSIAEQGHKSARPDPKREGGRRDHILTLKSRRIKPVAKQQRLDGERASVGWIGALEGGRIVHDNLELAFYFEFSIRKHLVTSLCDNHVKLFVARLTPVIAELYGFEAVETLFVEYTDMLGKRLPDQDLPNEGAFPF